MINHPFHFRINSYLIRSNFTKFFQIDGCTFFIPILIWNPISNLSLEDSFNPVLKKIENIASIINEKTDEYDIVLATNDVSQWILLLTGRHLAISGSPWCSNPTARYSLRYDDFFEAFSSDKIEIVKNRLNKWDVNILVFLKDVKELDKKEINP